MKRHLAVGVAVVAMALAAVAAAQSDNRGISKTEIVLGMHTDLSGPAATYGVSSSNAVKMRFDEANEKGGIHGRKIRLVIEDNGLNPAKAVRAVEKLVGSDKVFAVVSSFGTTPNIAAYGKAVEAGVPSAWGPK